MKKLLSTLLVLASGALPAFSGEPATPSSSPLAAAEEAPSFTLDASAGYINRYIFRGVDLGRDLTFAEVLAEVPLSDSLTASFSSWYGNVRGPYSEVDVTAGLSWDAGPVTLGAQFLWYHFPTGYYLENQYETGLTVSREFGPLELTVGWYYEFEVNGHFVEAVLACPQKLNDRVSIEPALTFGYNLGYNVPGNDLNHAGLIVEIPIKLGAHASLTPILAASVPLSALEDSEHALVYGGVKFTLSF